MGDYQLLELNVISAQDLAPLTRSMRTYAVAWIDPDRKLSTGVDSEGGVNPTWNEKFVFRVDKDFMYDETSVITIDIYALHWFKDIHVGTAEILTGDLIPPTNNTRPFKNNYKPPGMRFIGVQVHRPSGRPKGILNVGVAVIDSTMRSMPLYNNPPVRFNHDEDEHNHRHHDDHDIDFQGKSKPELRRTKSDTSSMIGPEPLTHEKQDNTKQGKGSSVIASSEISTKSKKSKKKGSSILSGSSEGRTKTKKGKSGNNKKGAKGNTSPEPTFSEYNNAVLYGTPLRVTGYEIKQSPRSQFRNSPAMGYKNTPYNKGGARATPLHAFAAMNAAMEYGTPYRSNLGRRPMMTNSELGPSASEVAAAVARMPVQEDGEDSTVGGWSLDESVDGFQPKIDRWRTELPPVYDSGELKSNMMTRSSRKGGRHSRMNLDDEGNNGLFSCFSVICGIECSIVCGGDRKKKNRSRHRAESIDDDASFI